MKPTTLELQTTNQVAKILGCHPATVRRLVESGAHAPAAKAPGPRGAYLFEPHAVTRLAIQRETRRQLHPTA